MRIFTQLRFVLLLFTFGLISGGVLGQQHFPMSDGTVTTCGGFFEDSGGASGNYQANENYTMTLCSDGTSGTHISLLLQGGLFLGAGDVLCFYDSDSATGNPLICSNDGDFPNSTIYIQATAENTTGCLTMVWTSDGQSEGVGWSALIECIPSCQTINSVLTSTDPAVMPVDTGWIDVCVGEEIEFMGEGFYPQNGIIYNQSDATSSFSWDFDDGDMAVGNHVIHSFDEPGGYYVELTIEDQLGCRNSNFIHQRVRVSTPPDFDIASDLTQMICAGDTISFNAIVDTIHHPNDISTIPTEGSFQAAGVLSDTLFLPDGSGASYSTSIAFTDFLPGATLTNPDDITGVCLDLEHSYGGDLDIEIICPSGQSVFLLEFGPGVGSTNFGEPYATAGVDGNSGDMTPGIPYHYCFENSGTDYGTLASESNNFNYEYTTVPGEDGNTHTYSDRYFPAGSYLPSQDFSGLLGCPLNGEWTIRVQDNLGLDNGWLFQWGIGFESYLYPDLETFTPSLTSWGWEQASGAIYTSADSLAAIPPNAGEAVYTFWVEDNYGRDGCRYDTTISLQILPPTHPDCYNCTEITTIVDEPEDICPGDEVTLTGATVLDTMFAVTFDAHPNVEISNSATPVNRPFIGNINVNSVSPGTITDPFAQIESVCIDLQAQFASDIEVYLIAPSGEILELTTRNGGFSPNYTNTCFEPSSGTSIVSGMPPFTGSFAPEGNWNDLTGATVNGNWQIQVSDYTGADVGVLDSWSITFNSVNDFNYSWSPGASVDCGDCLETTATPTVTTTYTLQTTDSYGCIDTDDVTVTMAPPIEITAEVDSVECFKGQEGRIRVDVSGGVPNYYYQWSPSGSGNSLTNLPAGTYLLTVTDESNCIGEASFEIYQPDSLGADIEGIGVLCFGDQNGKILIHPNGGTAPYRVSIDDERFYNTDQIVGLSPGTYPVYVVDDNNCAYETEVEVIEPALFELDAGDDWTITLGDSVEIWPTPINGTGDIEFIWYPPYEGTLSCDTCQNPLVYPQYSIIYEIYAEDENGCNDTDMLRVTVEKPRLAVVPEGFTPNGDNMNDVLLVHGLKNTRVLNFQVFDRWGELVYEASDFMVNDAIGWDGMFKGKPAPEGVYVWHMQVEYPFDKEQEVFMGQTTLIR